jgi:DNA-binding transcriptional MerR regulator
MSKKNGKFHYIGEISKLLGIPAHILRYWEKEFSFIKPMRDHRGHRIYTEDDMEKINQVKLLIYTEGYKIKGVKKYLRQSGNRMKENRNKKLLKKLIRDIGEIKKCLK